MQLLVGVDVVVGRGSRRVRHEQKGILIGHHLAVEGDARILHGVGAVVPLDLHTRQQYIYPHGSWVRVRVRVRVARFTSSHAHLSDASPLG